LRREAAPRGPAPRVSQPSPRGTCRVRARRRGAVGRPRVGGAPRERSDPSPPERRGRGRAHAARAPGRARRRSGSEQPRGGREAVPQPEDRRVPPRSHLSQARHLLTPRAVAAPRRLRGAVSAHDAWTAYIPDLVVDRLGSPFEPCEFEAVVLVVDVRGFTALSELLARDGARGTERLAATLSDF